MPKPIFITGIGTSVGKTIVSAIVTEALQADYWKPIQAGLSDSTDTELVESLVTNTHSKFFPETYRLGLAASPHISAREENIRIDIDKIVANFKDIQHNSNADYIIIEGAGGLLVPLNDADFVIDIIARLDASVIITSRNYLGSINHSLLTSEVCKQRKLKVLGWIFNDQYLNYQQDIVAWSGYQHLYNLPALPRISQQEIYKHSVLSRHNIINSMSIYQ